MQFKDCIEDEISSVFLNPEEFGEEHEIGKKTMHIVLEEFSNQPQNSEKHMLDNAGVFKKNVKISVSAMEFGKKPATGAILQLDGKPYQVVESYQHSGIYKIYMKAVSSHDKGRVFKAGY